MRGNDLLQDMEYIDEKLIEEAAAPKDLSKKETAKNKKKVMGYLGTFASVAAVALISVGAYRFASNSNRSDMAAPESINNTMMECVPEASMEEAAEEAAPLEVAEGIAISPDMSDGAEEYVEEMKRLIFVHGVVYYDSGKISNRTRDEKMDGYIDSICDNIPTKEGESNFGTGYGYQFGKGCVEVLIGEDWYIFYPYEPEKVYEPNEASVKE